MALPISSKMHQTIDHEYNIPIKNYAEAGLSKPSYVDVSTYGRVNESAINQTIGSLSNEDVLNISYEFAHSYLRQYLEQFLSMIK